ncbi:hypothetical protein [Terrimonas alba]|uniref:hypothetical protein n=1 Tax=Terrimonas alba TaxID=3349636 RepID=UPI0035F460C0
MPPLALDITPFSYPKDVRVLIGAPELLVARRNTYGAGSKYQTNRQIKYWSTWFLLKSLTTSSFIQHWTSQKKFILAWVQMGERTFRQHLKWLAKENLLIHDSSNPNSIRLVNFEDAAKKLGIEYTGTFRVSYDYKKNKYAKQTFQYLIRTEEFEYHKQRQAKAIMRKLEQNPALKKNIIYCIGQMGADYERLMSDPAYFIGRLLLLQVKMFKEGSEFLNYIMDLRADVNRGVILIKRHHGYRSSQSVSYMKRKMKEFGYAVIRPRAVESDVRSRFSVPVTEGTPDQDVLKDGRRNGYIWIPTKKVTVWRLCDQVKRNYDHQDNKLHSKTNLYAA